MVFSRMFGHKPKVESKEPVEPDDAEELVDT